jgi:hypothetical protein
MEILLSDFLAIRADNGSHQRHWAILAFQRLKPEQRSLLGPAGDHRG